MLRPYPQAQHRLCSSADNSKDPLDGMFLAWYGTPRDGKNDGMVCWYCGRVWFTYFRHDSETRTLSLLALAIGEDSVKYKDFDAKKGQA